MEYCPIQQSAFLPPSLTCNSDIKFLNLMTKYDNFNGKLFGKILTNEMKMLYFKRAKFTLAFKTNKQAFLSFEIKGQFRFFEINISFKKV